MKLIHIADLHLGKMLHQYSLIDIQKELLDQIMTFANENDADGLIIAGDIYDHSIPSQEAVNLLNTFLNQLITVYHKKVYMISGNHDSSDRLNFASRILENQGLYITTHLHEEIHFVQEGDTRIYLLPFVKPSTIHHLFEDAPNENYNEALQYYLSKQKIDDHYNNILVTHQFVGHASQTSDSELTLSVGGTEVIDPDIFSSFDYVALGHLHAPQYVKRETIRYSGSLARYSFDEVHQEKGFVFINTEDMSYQIIPQKPTIDVAVYRGRYEDFLKGQIIERKEDLLSIELTDDKIIPHAIDQLRLLYPHVLQLTYPHMLESNNLSLKHIEKIEKMDLVDLYKDFYEAMTSQSLETQEETIIKELLEGGEKHEA